MTPLEAFIKATKVRAAAYVYIYEEILKEVGEPAAKEVMGRAIYRLGIDSSEKYSREAKKSPRQLGKEFCADSVSREAFKKGILEEGDDFIKLEIKSCPLVQAWKEMGLSGNDINVMCDIAHKVDFGTMENLGYELIFPCRLAYNNDSCILELKKK